MLQIEPQLDPREEEFPPSLDDLDKNKAEKLGTS